MALSLGVYSRWVGKIYLLQTELLGMIGRRRIVGNNRINVDRLYIHFLSLLSIQSELSTSLKYTYFIMYLLPSILLLTWSFPLAWCDGNKPPPSDIGDPPMYPPQTESNTEPNSSGTRLYKYNGCSETQISQINEAYTDFGRLAQLDGVGANINWNEA